jgi:release factor glutamine methyltransferase
VDSAVVARLRAAGCVYAEDEARLLVEAAASPAELDAMVARRAAGAPLEQVLGWAEFCGRRIRVSAGVFVPRRRTEALVREAIRIIRERRQPAEAVDVVVDLCCGSGALGLVVASSLRGIELHAADLDAAAVGCARVNLAEVGGRVYQGDLFAALPEQLRGRVDVVLANVPYVPTEQIRLLPAEARLHEPLHSLDGGADGLDVLRRVMAAAPEWLSPRGLLLSEVGADQAATAARLASDIGLQPRLARVADTDATILVAHR